MLLELFLAPFWGLAITGAAYVPLPTQLGNLAFSQINFTENCSNIALGISVFQNDFFKAKVYPLAELTNGAGYWPDGYLDVWRDGKPSVEWIAFWRAIVDSNLPKNYEPFSDDQIAAWADSTDFLEFFSWIWNADYITDPKELAYYLSIGGGCNNYQFPPIQYLFIYIAECMFFYCCPRKVLNSSLPFPYYTKWTIQDTCAFETCSSLNKGSPDLGGIGIIVSYFIECALLGLTCILFALRWLPNKIYKGSRRPVSNAVKRHPGFLLKTAEAFLDNAAFISLSVSIAGIAYNSKKQEPLIYEDKLAQASTLLAVNAPVAVLLLTYEDLERWKFRSFLVGAAAFLAFAIQFKFRKAKTFDWAGSICLDWADDDETRFTHLFISEAVWALLVVLFFGIRLAFWMREHYGHRWTQFPFMPRRAHHKNTQPDMSDDSQLQGASGEFYSLIPSPILHAFSRLYTKIPWRRVVATLLAFYGLLDTIMALLFIRQLRDQEKYISADDSDTEWGYGQILALFIWLPACYELIVELWDVFGVRVLDILCGCVARKRYGLSSGERGSDSPNPGGSEGELTALPRVIGVGRTADTQGVYRPIRGT